MKLTLKDLPEQPAWTKYGDDRWWRDPGLYPARPLAEMLNDHVIFLNYDTEKPGQYSLDVNCNDLFYWACADAEPLPFDQIEQVYVAWKLGGYALDKWTCHRRNLRPQVPVVTKMKEAGEWDDEMESLPAPAPS